jgi:uncharacterized repeat protein (TIGR01451 family)
MITSRNPTRRLPWAAIAGTSALLLTVVLLLLLSHLQALAQPTAGFVVEKMVNTSQAGPGETLTYTIRIEQVPGPPVNGIQLTDTLVDEVTYVPGTLTADYGAFGFESGVVTWTGNLGMVSITFSVQISPEIGLATIVNTAVVTGEGDLVTDSISTQVSPANLVASKSVHPPSAHLGGQLLYTIRITNTGNGTADPASMTDHLPPQVSYVDNSLHVSGPGSANFSDSTIAWSGSLGPSEAVTVTFASRIATTLTEDTVFANTAEITGAGSLVTTSVEATAVITSEMWLPFIRLNYPPIAVLNPIPAPGDNNAYIVSWQPDLACIDQFVLQEALDASFNTISEVFTTTANSQSVQKGSTVGAFYYRVRADGAWGAGRWSNVESVSIGYYDNFDDPSSGWPIRSGEIRDDRNELHGHWYTHYYGSDYRIFVEDATCRVCDWFYQPDALAPYSPPSNKYCVETTVRFEEGHYWANMGLVFGANDANTTLYALCLARDSDQEKLGWFLVRQDDYELGKLGCAKPDASIGGGNRDGTSRYGWNRLQVGVDGDVFTVYIGGYYKGQYTMGGLSNMTRVGVVGGDAEIPPIDIRYAYFKVIPNVACTP